MNGASDADVTDQLCNMFSILLPLSPHSMHALAFSIIEVWFLKFMVTLFLDILLPPANDCIDFVWPMYCELFKIHLTLLGVFRGTWHLTMAGNTPLLVVLLMSVLVWAVDSSLKVQVEVENSEEDVTAHPEAQHTDPGHLDHGIHLGMTKNKHI